MDEKETNVSASARDLRERRSSNGTPILKRSIEEKRAYWRERKRELRDKRDGAPGEDRPRRTRAYKDDGEETKDPRPPYRADEQSIKMCGTLGNVLWEFSRMFHGRRAWTPAESRKFGEALDPVLYKYLPVLNDWAVEMNLVGTTWELWSATAPEKVPETVPPGKEPSDSSATVLE